MKSKKKKKRKRIIENDSDNDDDESITYEHLPPKESEEKVQETSQQVPEQPENSSILNKNTEETVLDKQNPENPTPMEVAVDPGQDNVVSNPIPNPNPNPILNPNLGDNLIPNPNFEEEYRRKKKVN